MCNFGLSDGLSPSSWQAITLTNNDRVHWRIIYVTRPQWVTGFNYSFMFYFLSSYILSSSSVSWHNGAFFTVRLSRSYYNEVPWQMSCMYICFVLIFDFFFWVCVRFCSQESLINMYVNQMDESHNLGPGAPSINDLNNVLRYFVDDPNNKVRTYSDSLYIPTENVENISSQYPNNFSVFSLNIQSLNSKFDSLLAFLSHLDEKGYNFDAICLQETWLSPKCDTSLFNIPGYHLTYQGKTCSQHSGLISYLLVKFSCSIKDIQVKSELWDEQFIDIYGENLTGKITVGNIYRPPRSNNNNVTLRKFISEIEPVISNIAHKNNCSIITGDFNIDLLQINEIVEIQKYFDLFVTQGFFPKITLPTQPSKYNASLIDQLFCKLNNPKQHLVSCIIQS